MTGTEFGNVKDTDVLAVPRRDLKEGEACLLDGKILLVFHGIHGFFAEVEGSLGMRFRVPAERVTAPRAVAV